MRKKRFIYSKKLDYVYKWNSFINEYEIVGCHQDFGIHSDFNERYKDKIMRVHYDKDL